MTSDRTTCHSKPAIISIHRKIPGSIRTLGAKAGNTTQASRPIGTVAKAQIVSIFHNNYVYVPKKRESIPIL